MGLALSALSRGLTNVFEGAIADVWRPPARRRQPPSFIQRYSATRPASYDGIVIAARIRYTYFYMINSRHQSARVTPPTVSVTIALRSVPSVWTDDESTTKPLAIAARSIRSITFSILTENDEFTTRSRSLSEITLEIIWLQSGSTIRSTIHDSPFAIE